MAFAKFLRFCKGCVSTASIVTAAQLSPIECIVFPANHFLSMMNIRSHHEESLNLLLPLTSSCQCLGVATLSGHESSYFLTIQPHSLGMLYVVSSDFYSSLSYTHEKMPTISGVHSGFWINWGEFIPSYFVAEIFIVRAGGGWLVQRDTHSADEIRCAITVPSLGVKYS